jgi:hypothetical protein
MDLATLYYLGTTLILLLVFAGIILRTLHPKRRLQGEKAKYRMLEGD